MSNQIVKPGDKVWIFTGQQIQHFIVDYMPDDDIICGFLDNGVSIRVMLPYPIFHSREALCEHYRKIFEDEQDNHHSV